MQTVELTIETRSGEGKGPARRLRRTGLAPAVLYGPKRTAVSIAVSASEFDRRVARLEGAHLIRLMPKEGQATLAETMVLLREIQRHPVSGLLIHADFYEVDLTEKVTVSVPLRFVGKAAGVTAGGVLQPICREIDVECLPTEIPEFIEVDVAALAMHASLPVKDVPLPTGVTAVGDLDLPVVTVVAPTVDATPSAAAEAAPAAGAGAAPDAGGKAAPGKAAPAKGAPAKAAPAKPGGK
jgi:large subunit ribosomal protein L25